MKNKNPWPDLFVFLLVPLLMIWGFFKQPIIKSFAGAPTVTPIMTATPLPPVDTIYLKLPAEQVAQLDSFSNATPAPNRMKAQLLLVIKKPAATQNGTSVAQQHSAEKFCVEVEAFLDKDNLRSEYYKAKDTESVLVILKTADLARYAAAELDQERMYLAPDSTCNN